MSEKHELKTLTLAGETFNSFLDQEAREDIEALKKSSASRNRHPRKMISFMDDDCRAAVAGPDNDRSLEYLIDRKKIPYTLACPPGNIVEGNDGTYMTATDLQRMVGKGVTVSCHAWRQYNMDNTEQYPTMDALRAELEKCQAQFDAWGIPVTTMSYPQGRYVDEYMPVVRQHYRAGFTVANGINQIPYASYYMDRVGLFEDDASDDGTASLAAAKEWVDKLAEMESGWLIFMTHAWYKGFRPAVLGELIEYIQSDEIRAKGIEIVDIHEALDTTGNIIEAGTVKKPFADRTEPFFVVDAAGVAHTNALHKYARSAYKITEVNANYNTGVYLKPAGGKQDHSDSNRIVSLDIPVQPGEVYRLSCAAVYGNLAYCIYNSEIGASVFSEADSYLVANTEDGEVLTDHEITVPDGATYMRVSGHLKYQPDGFKILKVEYVDGETPDDSGSGYTLPVGGDNLGGVKNGGNVVINPDGTMTAPASDSSQNVDLSGYAKETWVRDGFQPKGNYLTAVPDGYATEDYVKNKVAEVNLGGWQKIGEVVFTGDTIPIADYTDGKVTIDSAYGFTGGTHFVRKPNYTGHVLCGFRATETPDVFTVSTYDSGNTPSFTAADYVIEKADAAGAQIAIDGEFTHLRVRLTTPCAYWKGARTGITLGYAGFNLEASDRGNWNEKCIEYVAETEASPFDGYSYIHRTIKGGSGVSNPLSEISVIATPGVPENLTIGHYNGKIAVGTKVELWGKTH